MTPCVYLIEHIDSGRVYVGKTNNPESRWCEHKSCARNPDRRSCSHIHAALAKHSPSTFTFNVIEWCASEEDALAAETYWIEWYRSTAREFGFNIEAGGRGGKRLSEETKLKISASQLARKVRLTPDQRAAKASVLRDPATVAKNPAVVRGRRLTDEHKAKLRLAMNNGGSKKVSESKLRASAQRKANGIVRTLSAEHVAKVVAHHIGRKRSAETRQRIADAKRNISDETRARMSASAKLRKAREKLEREAASAGKD